MWCPLSGSVVRVRRSSVRPSGVQCIQCPACPVSGRLVSTRPVSGRPVSTRPVSTRPVSTRPVSTRLLSASVRPDASSRPTSGGGGDQVEAAGNRHHRNGSSPGELPRRGAARWTAEQARTRATLPGSRIGQWGRWRTRARWGDGARPRLTGCATRQARPACGAPPLPAARWAREQAPARGAAAAAWLASWAGWATTVGGGHGACRPGGWARRGQWACRRDGRAAPARPRLAAGAPGSLPTAL
jgi:hypothetical protein